MMDLGFWNLLPLRPASRSGFRILDSRPLEFCALAWVGFWILDLEVCASVASLWILDPQSGFWSSGFGLLREGLKLDSGFWI